MAKDYYAVLGVDKNASSEEIKQAFRKLAHQFHPDKASGNTEKFKEINEAYQVLSDDTKRRQYDQFGSAFDQGGVGDDAGGFRWQDVAQGFGFGGVSGGMNVDFGDLGEIFGDMFGFGGSPGRGRSSRGGKIKGRDLEFSVQVSLKEAYTGFEKEMSVERYETCSACRGTGGQDGKVHPCQTCGGSGTVTSHQRTFFGTFAAQSVCPECRGEGQIPKEKCHTCKGSGRVKHHSVLKVKIPRGIEDGSSIRVRGEGEAGERGGASGDLFVHVRVEPDARFTRKEHDLYTSVDVTFAQAALGTKIPFSTFDEDLLIKVPEGVQSGDIIKFKGKGMPRLQASGHGDLLVEVKVHTPKNLSRKAKKLLEELEQELESST